MAESDSKYKDSFISQDDLDALMKEAGDLGPEAFSTSAPAGNADSPDPSDDGEDVISQDDIDALLNLADGSGDSADDADDGEEVISQEDIDALLAGNAKPDPPAVPTPLDDDVEDDTADLDLVSPEDIEKLLRTEDLDGSDAGEEQESSPANSLETITQEDLKDLSGSMEIKAEAGPAGDDDDDSLISQDDIDALLSGSVPQDDTGPDAITPVPIEDSGAEEDDSLISQDDIDKLLAGTDGDDSEVAPVPEQEPEPEPETAVAAEDSTDDDSNLISQEDIDKLLLGKSEEVESEETLIDQDDIDRLLSSAAPLDEDKLAGQGDQDKFISQEDIDRLLNEDVSEAIPGKDERPIDQVILEEDTDAGDSGSEEGKEKAAWFRSKLFISGMAVALVLIVSVVVISIFSGKPGQEAPPVAVNIPETETVQPDAVPEEPYPMDEFTPRTYDMISVTMNGFVVPAPAKIKGLSYIALDLTFEISNAPSNPIKDYEPFFRNIVYEVLNKAFILQSESKIVEADLKNMIRNALNDALSEGSVSQIDFINFKVG